MKGIVLLAMSMVAVALFYSARALDSAIDKAAIEALR
jgi:hypothetical protein